MSDFNIARKNMIHNQLMTNNIVEDHILKAFNIIPREIFLPFDLLNLEDYLRVLPHS